MNLKWLFPSQKSWRGRERQMLSTYKHIMDDPELHDARHEKCEKQYIVAKQKKKVRKASKKVIKAQQLK